MRKAVAIFFLCIYVLLQAGPVGWYLYKPLAHAYFLQQSRDIAVNDTQKLITLTLGRDKLNALKNGENEIVMDGVLYDVESSASSGDMITVLLKKDSKETNWNDHYKNLTRLLHKNTGGAPLAAGKISFTLLPLFYCREISRDTYLVKYLHKISRHLSAPHYPAPFNDILTPPPRLC